MTNCTRSTMNWHSYPKDFLWIESNFELRARLIGSIIIGDRGSACWAISVINSALDSLQSEGIHHWTCHVRFNFYFITAPSRIPPFVCPRAFSLVAKKNFGKKKTITQIFSHCSKRNREVGTGVGRGEAGSRCCWFWKSYQHANIVWNSQTECVLVCIRYNIVLFNTYTRIELFL